MGLIRKRRSFVELLEQRMLLAASLVRDVNSAGGGNSSPANFIEINGTMFFTAADSAHGTELWKTDGTAASVAMVKDLMPGSAGSSPNSFVNVNGTLFFCANTNSSTTELWKSDGTAAGTIRLRTFNKSPIAKGVGNLVALTNVNGTLFFGGDDGAHGLELWKSNGTVAGTEMIKDIRPGLETSSSLFDSMQMASMNGVAYFQANDGVTGIEFWKSDGTAAGTVMVKEFVAGNNATTIPCGHFANMNGTLYFNAGTDVNNRELWKSDGTTAGTVFIKEIDPSPTVAGLPSEFFFANNTIYFRGIDSTHGAELWTTDGTAAGTVLVKDINPGPGSSLSTSFNNGTPIFALLNGSVYIMTNSALWTTDGTEAGTTLIKSSVVHSGFIVSSNSLYFIAANSLWKSDGTTAGTNSLATLGAASGIGAVNGIVLCPGNDIHGLELWRSDGTVAGTKFLKDINAGVNGSSLFNLTNFNGTLFFGADDGFNGLELYKTSGNDETTSLVKDIFPGTSSGLTAGATTRFTNINGTLYFPANDGTHGIELWKTDGTAAGTVMVKDIRGGSSSSSPITLTNVDGTLFFFANDGVNGIELWKSDGSDAGTVFVKDIQPGAGSGGLQAGTMLPPSAGGILYFQANDGINGPELWRSDGTSAGTYLLKDINPGTGAGAPVNLNYINGLVVFRADDGEHGSEIWRTDGTAVGTILVKDIYPGASGSTPQLVNINGQLFFRADDGTHGTELWTSDGSESGTQLVKDISPGSANSSPTTITNVNGDAYFQASDGVHGSELWKSDGTPAGTVMIKDITPGGANSSLASLTNAGGTLFFTSNNGIGAAELWKSDGTPGGTMAVMDNSAPALLTSINSTLFFAATDPANIIGQELYKITNETPATVLHIPGDADGAGQNDSIHIVRNQTNPSLLDVSVTNVAGTTVTTYYFPSLAQVVIDALGGNNQVTIDSSIDNAIPAGGLIFNAVAGNDTVDYSAASAGDGPIAYAGGGGSDELNVLVGSFTTNVDNGAGTSDLTINLSNGATASFNASQHLDALNVNGGMATLVAGGSKVLHATTISTSANGRLDLTDNDMIVTGMTRAAVESLVQSGFGNFDWQGAGITSSTAAAFAQIDGSRALGVIDNADWGYGTFSGETVSGTDILVKFTWTGDANLDGLVDNDDFGQFLYGFTGGGSPTWLNGDFDLNGIVDNDDFGWLLTGMSAFNASGNTQL